MSGTFTFKGIGNGGISKAAALFWSRIARGENEMPCTGSAEQKTEKSATFDQISLF